MDDIEKMIKEVRRMSGDKRREVLEKVQSDKELMQKLNSLLSDDALKKKLKDISGK